MSASEAEIFSLLFETFRKAAELCDAIAVKPARGPSYRQLVKELKTAENCCRQIAQYRAHYWWLNVGNYMEETHKRAGGWLRDRSMIRTESANPAHPLFVKLAEHLRFAMKIADDRRTQATGRVGAILPEPLPPPTRTSGRPVAVNARISSGGIIIPDGVSVH